jgi:hypothetical protein
MIKQAFREESMSHTRVFEWHAQFRAKSKQSQEHAHHFLWLQWDCSQGIDLGGPNSQFHILLWRATVAAWKCVKTSSELWRQKKLLLHDDDAKTHTSFFHQETFDQKQHDCRPHSPYFSLLPRLIISLISRNVDTIEVLDAESQAVLNTFTEQDFQKAFKNGRRAGNCIYAWKGTTSMVMVASRRKGNLWTNGSISPENYGWLLYSSLHLKQSYGCRSHHVSCSITLLFTYIFSKCQRLKNKMCLLLYSVFSADHNIILLTET